MIRVTQVLSLFQNLWKIPEEVLARKGQIGRSLHEAIFDYLFADPGNMITHLEREHYPYLKSFSEWATTQKFNIKIFEERFTDEKLGFTGQPDAVFEMDGTSFLYDFKTSLKDDPVSWRLQGTAYIHLLRSAGHNISDTFFFLKLRKDSKRADTYSYKYTPEGLDTFLKALDCAKYFQKWKGTLPDLE